MVLPTYRRPDLLARALSSVKEQTFGDWELIVVDDNDPLSPEREQTRSLMTHQDDPRVRYLEHDRNRGGSAARNTGIRAASAPLVAFLDDDDSWYPHKLERQVAHLEASPESTALVYCAFRHVARDGASHVVRPSDGGHTVAALLTKNQVGTTSAVVCRKSALLEVGGFDESLASRQDVDLYLRLAQRFELTYVADVLLDFHRHDGAAIGTNMLKALEANERFDLKHADLYAQHPDAAHYRLLTKGTNLRWAGQRPQARATFVAAWRARPLDLRALVGLLATSPVADLARALRDTLRRAVVGSVGSK